METNIVMRFVCKRKENKINTESMIVKGSIRFTPVNNTLSISKIVIAKSIYHRPEYDRRVMRSQEIFGDSRC